MQKIEHRGAPLRIARRADDAVRLVQRDVNETVGLLDQAAVDFDVVVLGIGFRAQFGD